ncbi:MAG: formylglycine-generating enzyme family protein [Gammaproteobacteria bacterium]|nr:formylglycine-generating enzyme family protein [Gammaproteobacteria bacterium]
MEHRILFLFLFFFSVNSMAAEALPDPVKMVRVPASEFVMGSDKQQQVALQTEFGSLKPWYMDEHPQHQEFVDEFFIDETEVTNRQFREFVVAKGQQPPKHWLENGYLVSLKKDKLKALSVVRLRHVAVNVFRMDLDVRDMSKLQILAVIDKYFAKLDVLPVYNVNWFTAQAYCEWTGKHLPTEAQWEKAARGVKGNEFPWGNQWKPGMSNTGDEEWDFGVAPVHSYESDLSSFGIYDLAGNVSEWVQDWYQAYQNSDYQSDQFGQKFKVVRGAGWGSDGHYALQMYQRGAYRLFLSPDAEHEDLGFRCVKNTTPVKNKKQLAAH